MKIKIMEVNNMFLFVVIVVAIALSIFTPTDSTDVSRWDRSGLSVYTDNATCVQYVKAGFFGGITVRVDKNGKPLMECF